MTRKKLKDYMVEKYFKEAEEHEVSTTYNYRTVEANVSKVRLWTKTLERLVYYSEPSTFACTIDGICEGDYDKVKRCLESC